jgi:uncharacterized RDD family membrane protein YckC
MAGFRQETRREVAAGVVHADPVPRPARLLQGRRAGVVSRVAAAAVDGALLLAFLACCYLAALGVVFLWNPARFSAPSFPFWLVLVVAGCTSTLYLVVCWVVAGRTYGDLVLALRVVDRRGGHPSFLLALVRAVGCVLVPLGLLWTAVNRQNRSLQDIVVRTSVVYDWHGPDHGL